jgi:hypothetical protein
MNYIILLLGLATQPPRRPPGVRVDTVRIVDTVRLVDTVALRPPVPATDHTGETVAIIAAIIAAAGTVAAAYYTKTGSDTAHLQLAESRAVRAEQRAVAITAVGVEMSRIVRASVRWRSETIVEEAAAETLDWSDLEPPEWSQFLLVLAQLGQTGAMLAGVAYGDLRDAGVYGRRLRFKAKELQEAREKLEGGRIVRTEFDRRREQWKAQIETTIVKPLCGKLDDAHEALNEALTASTDERRRASIDVSGLKSKAARRWQAGLDDEGSGSDPD